MTNPKPVILETPSSLKAVYSAPVGVTTTTVGSAIAEPAIAILPSLRTARSTKISFPETSMMTEPSLSNELSNVPSELIRAMYKSLFVADVAVTPAIMMSPSDKTVPE